MNRRLPAGDSYRNSPNPDGPMDHTVPVLVVRDADGNVVTTLKITGNNLEAWLVDADVEKKDDAPKGEESDS